MRFRSEGIKAKNAFLATSRFPVLGNSRGTISTQRALHILVIILTMCFLSSCSAGRLPVPGHHSQIERGERVSRTDAPHLKTPLLTKEQAQRIATVPLTKRETGEVLNTAAGNFFYGPGLGETALDLTGAVLFPPYAFVLAGQTLVRLAGYDSPRLVELLPDEQQRSYNGFMEAVYSGPGRLISAATGEEYRNRSRVRLHWRETVAKLEATRVPIPFEDPSHQDSSAGYAALQATVAEDSSLKRLERRMAPRFFPVGIAFQPTEDTIETQRIGASRSG